MESITDGYASTLEKMKKMPRSELIKKAAEAKRSQKEALANVRGNPTNYATIMKSNRQYAELKVHNPVLASEVKRVVGDNFYRIDFTHEGESFILYATNMGKENRLAKRIFGRPFRGNVLIAGLKNAAKLSKVEKWVHVSLEKTAQDASALQDSSSPISSSSSSEIVETVLPGSVLLHTIPSDSVSSDSVSSDSEEEDVDIISDTTSTESAVHPYED